MDLKDLNKPQLLLLAVLLSFITSIATGITTVTLMQQAPDSVTVPVNRIVKQTVEKIQQVEGKTTVQTVVVKEEDLVVDAISKNQSAVFTITKDGQDPSTGASADIALSRAFAVKSDGTLVADGGLINGGDNYFANNSNGKFKANFVSVNPGGFAVLKLGDPVDGKSKASFTVPTPGDITKMKIGQKIILFGNKISSFIYEGNKDPGLSVSSKGDAGGMVLDLDGEVLGMALFSDSKNFVSIKVIDDALGIEPPPPVSAPAE